MAQPTTREELKQYCLRALGKPAIRIEITDEQCEDRIDEALKFYADYHFDGSEKRYYKHQCTQDDIDNGYITVPENIIGVVSIFPINDVLTTNSMFNIRYQYMLNYINDITTAQVQGYYIARQYLEVLEEVFVGRHSLRFSRHRNRIEVDWNWDLVSPGEWLIFETYEVIDPEDFPNVWNDRWLAKYITTLFKEQWGGNITKYVGQQLLGGVAFDGRKILEDAQQERLKLEAEMYDTYSLPNAMQIG